MQTKFLKDRPTRGEGKEKFGEGGNCPLPHAGYGPDAEIYQVKCYQWLCDNY